MIKKKMEYNKYKDLKNTNEKKVNILSSLRLITFIMMLLCFILKHYYLELFFNYLFILFLITFIILVLIHDKYYKIYNYYNNYLEIIETYIKRTNGEWKNFEDTGEFFLKDNNHFFSDLDILGKNSLYQLLNIAKTMGGKRKLVSRLSNNNLKNLKEEQSAIKELTENINFCLDYQVILSNYNEKNIDLSSNFQELSTKINLRGQDLILGIVLTTLTITSLLLSLLKIISTRYFYLILIINFLINTLYSYMYKQEYNKLNLIINNYSNMNNLFKSILNTNFTSKKLLTMKNNINTNYNIFTKLEKFEIFNNLKNNILSNFIFNSITNLNVFLLYYFNKRSRWYRRE